MGYTTGSCAAAAAKGAAYMLLTGREFTEVELLTPKGIKLNLELLEVKREATSVTCAVRKDGGDDPDATHGLLVYATVTKQESPKFSLDGGVGVGRVTKPGLEQAVGDAAINRVPRQMIENEVMSVMEELEYPSGVKVVISVPGGVEVAKKTFNPRLGIMGGISILGTTGIVEPMSDAALIRSIEIEMNMQVVNGTKHLLMTPGNYGKTFIKEHMKELDANKVIKCSNYLAETVDMAVNKDVKSILFVSHLGKFIKVAGGIMNTHSHHADCRAELMAAFAIRAGANLEQAKKLLDCITTEEALGFCKEWGLLEKMIPLIIEKIIYYLDHRAYGRLEIGVVLFSNEFGLLGMSDNVSELIKNL
ncbi:Cobalt-precorrin-6 synthase, anaerobic [Lachnospiraceae bacterium TWA4]|nr:Cobalt-precorrin-6 synthase, anaerobic [Lachnospiraceae bacterium TWA4]